MEKVGAVLVTGGCLCGAVRFEGEAFTRAAYYCHCTTCQKSSGEPFEIGVLIKTGTLRFTKGEPTYFQSSSFGKRGFCSVCGSRLLWAPVDPVDEWTTNVAVCALDNPADVRPRCHTYTDTKLPWLKIADGLPSYAEAEMPAIIERWKAECTSP
jgi:hypothetical protein